MLERLVKVLCLVRQMVRSWAKTAKSVGVVTAAVTLVAYASFDAKSSVLILFELLPPLTAIIKSICMCLEKESMPAAFKDL